jgi:hypothetical protein
VVLFYYVELYQFIDSDALQLRLRKDGGEIFPACPVIQSVAYDNVTIEQKILNIVMVIWKHCRERGEVF